MYCPHVKFGVMITCTVDFVFCSNPNEGTLLLCISVYAVSVDVLTLAVDLHKTASR